jgi:hypothetical protein
MAFSLFSGPKEKIYLILTIDSGSVSGALVSTNKEINQLINKTQARYMFAASMQFRGFKNRDGEKELENVKKALDVVIKTLLSNNTKIDHVHVSFSSPWIISKTNHISIAQEKTFVITEGFLNDIMDKEQKSIEKTMSMDETELIERAMYDTKINGYDMPNPFGRHTKTFEFSLYIAGLSKKIIAVVSEQVFFHTHLHRDKISMHTVPFVTFSALHDLAPMDNLLLDISPEKTDVSLVYRGLLEKTVSFPSGTQFIVREIMKIMDVSEEIASSTLTLFIEQKLDKEVSDKVMLAMQNVEKEWAIYFEDALSDLNPAFALPKEMYITAHQDFSILYENFLKIDKMDNTNAFRNSLMIKKIDKETLLSKIEINPRSMFDARLAMTAICALQYLKR